MRLLKVPLVVLDGPRRDRQHRLAGDQVRADLGGLAGRQDGRFADQAHRDGRVHAQGFGDDGVEEGRGGESGPVGWCVWGEGGGDLGV